MNHSKDQLLIKKIRFWLGFLIVTITLLTFMQSLSANFLMFDDNLFIYQNEHLGDLNWERLKLIFQNKMVSSSWYTPLTGLTFSTVFSLFGSAPVGFHLVNILFHSFNALILFLILIKIVQIKYPESYSFDSPYLKHLIIGAFLGTLLWSIHPLRVEAVAWAVCSYAQALFFSLMAVWFYLKHHQYHGIDNKKKQSHFIWIVLSLMMYLASLLTQPVGIGFIVVIFILDAYFQKNRPRLIHWYKAGGSLGLFEKMLFIGIAASSLFINVINQIVAPVGGHALVSYAQFGLFSRIMQAMYIWAYYLWRPLYPFDLSPIYTQLINFNPISWPFLISAFSITGSLLVLLLLRPRFSGVFALFICHMVLLLPVLGFTSLPYYPSDRYAYMVHICLAVGFVYSSIWLAKRKMYFWIAMGISAIVILGLSFLSVQQLKVWKNSQQFFQHIIKTIQSDTYAADIHWRLGIVLKQQGQIEQAKYHFEQTLTIHPNHGRAHYYLGSIALENHDPIEAIMQFKQAIHGMPDDYRAYHWLGVAFFYNRQFNQALLYWQKALDINPNFIGTLKDISWLLAVYTDCKFYNPQKAFKYAQHACELTKYSDATLLETLSVSLAALGQYENAVRIIYQALHLAKASQKKVLFARLRNRLQLFQQKKTFQIKNQNAILSE